MKKILSWTLVSDSTLVVVSDQFETLTSTKSNPNWDKILEAIRQKDDEAVLRLISVKDALVDFFYGKVAIRKNEVWYGNQVLHGKDVSRTLELMRMDVPVEPMVRFLDAKMRNPSRRAVNEMYNFLTSEFVEKGGGMPITPNGTILGYKGVRKDYYSISGNKSTVVLKGKVDDEGHILNEIGAEIEVARNSVCDDYQVGCAEGLHIGTKSYAESWAGPNGRVLLVEFSPEDVVSVPEDCSFQKLRACKYIVRGECNPETKLNQTYTTDYTPSPDVEEEDEIGAGVPPTQNEDDNKLGYDEGYKVGVKHGRGHVARVYFNRNQTPHENHTSEFVLGYCDGYTDYRSGERAN